MFDWLGDFFKSLFDLFPKLAYLLYASLTCVLDVLQLFFRKLAGLDIYYVDGKPQTGDILTNFITGILNINTDGSIFYSVLSTVFWSFVIFGLVILFASTLIAIIKSHYTYDDKAAKGPMQHVYTAVKAVVNMVAVPIIVVLGLYVSQAILTALDSITTVSSGDAIGLYGNSTEQDSEGNVVSLAGKYLISVDTSQNAVGQSKEKTYIYYDIFGFSCSINYGPDAQSSLPSTKPELALIGAKTQPFSGSLFRIAAFNANRARLGQMDYRNGNFSGAKGSDMELFGNATSNENLAEMIDTAFAGNFHLQNTTEVDYSFNNGIVSKKYFTNYYCRTFSSFSKFNVGLVWYYYDLWNFNFIVGFAAIIICLTVFVNIILGLIARLFMCVGLFLVSPPLFGLAPLDGGKAGKSWRESFMKQVLMAYGAVVGMNLMLIMLPYFNSITFFNIPIADIFAQTLVLIVGLITVKAFISAMSGLIDGDDANKSGEGVSSDVGSSIGKGITGLKTAVALPMNATKLAKNVGGAAWNLGGSAKNAVLGAKDKVLQGKNKIQAKTHGKIADSQEKKAESIEKMNKKDKLLTQFTDTYRNGSASEADVLAAAGAAGLSNRESKDMVKALDLFNNSKVPLLKDEKGNPMPASVQVKEALARTDKSYYREFRDSTSAERSQAADNLNTKSLKNMYTQDNYNLRSRERKVKASVNFDNSKDGAKKSATYLARASSNVNSALSATYRMTAKGDKMVKSLVDEVNPKAESDKQTAKELAFQSKLATWQAKNPGKAITQEELNRLR